MKKAPYLGKVILYWCDICNIPLLENIRCQICETKQQHDSKTRKVRITPPGDIRPAFDDDYVVLRETINREFGDGQNMALGREVFPSENNVLLNSVGGLDRVDDLIMDVINMGHLIYDIITQKYTRSPPLYSLSI